MQSNLHDLASTRVTNPSGQAKGHRRPASVLGLGFYSAFEYATIGMLLLDGRNNCLAANRALCKLLECKEPELLGQGYSTFISPPERAEALQCFQRMFAGDSTLCAAERHYVTRGGQCLSGLMSASAVMSTDEKPLWVIVQFQDMSECQRSAEKQRTLAEMLSEASLGLHSTLNARQVLDRLLDHADRVAPCDAINIMLVDPKTEEAYVVRTRSHVGSGAGNRDGQLRFPITSIKGLPEMMQTGQPLTVPDVCKEPDWVTFAELHWLRSYAVVPIRMKDQTVGFLNFNSATPGFFNAAHLESALALANQAALALENARAFETAQRNVEQLALLQQATIALARAESVEALYHEVLHWARTLTKASAATLALFDGLAHLVIAAGEGVHTDVMGARIGLSETVYGEAARLRHTVQVQNYGKWPGHAAALSNEGIDSIVALPLIWEDHLVGTLGVGDATEREFSTEDIHILELFAALAAAAVEQRRALSTLQAREIEANILNTWLANTQEEERTRIAEQLHDTISARLVTLQKSTEIILNTLWPDDPLAGQLSDAQRMLQETHQQARSLALELNAKVLDDQGINPAARQYVAHLSATTGIDIHLHVIGHVRRLSTEIEHMAYHGLQEVIANALHHADVTHIAVQIHFGAKWLRLAVQDDGHEFDAKSAQAGGNGTSPGLPELRRQVEALQGQFMMESVRDHGTQVILSLPCQEVVTSEKTRARVLLVDDHEISRQGMRMMLAQSTEFTCIGEALDGLQAVQQVELLHPDLVVMDVKLPRLSGIDASRQITRRFPHVRVAILSYYNDEAYLQQAFQAGAQGYLLKSDEGREIIAGLRAVCEDKRYISAGLAGVWEHLQAEPAASDPLGPLTTREREVFGLIVAGNTNRKVGESLGISVRTVEVYRKNIMSKLAVKNLAQLVQFAHDRLRN